LIIWLLQVVVEAVDIILAAVVLVDLELVQVYLLPQELLIQ
jgi:hypothetical protein